MNRRKYLAASATLLGTAGCLSGRLDDEETTTKTTTESPTPLSTGKTSTTSKTTALDSNDEPTVRTTTTPETEVETVLSFGEWYTSSRDWGITVRDFVFTTEFYESFPQSDNSGWHEMPDDEQLLFVSLQFKNLEQEERHEPSAFDPVFAAFVDGTNYESTGSFSHPDYSKNVDMDWLDLKLPGNRIGGTETVASGEVIDKWTGHILPRTVSESEISIGFSGFYSDGYSIHWR